MTEFGRILADLNAGGVRYVLIGAIALTSHGVVRATRDVDALFAVDGDNLAAVRALVVRWGATRPDGSPVAAEELSGLRTVHLSTPHGELDLLPERPDPLSFAAVSARSQTRTVDGTPAPVCALADLVALKRIAGRPRDEADLRDLETTHGELPDSREDGA